MMGADLAYMGTRFINTTESLVNDEYRQMVIDAQPDDIIYTPKVSGVHASFMKESLVAAGIDPTDLTPKETIDYGSDLKVDAKEEGAKKETKKGAWSDIWSAGQGVAAIDNVLPVSDLIHELETQYHEAYRDQNEVYLGRYGKK